MTSFDNHPNNKIVFLAKNLVVGYPNFSVGNINFEINSGKIIGLVGASGCGKSTLIKTILGIIKPISGKFKLMINGEEESLTNQVGYSPQDNSLYEYLTLDENLALFSNFYNVSELDFNKRKKSLLTLLDLKRHKDVLISNYSGGMRKRADIALSLIHDPRIIILDEPFNGLDIAMQDFIWDLLLKLAKDGKIIFVTSHYLYDIEKYCDDIYFIHNHKFYNYYNIKSHIKYKGNLSNFIKSIIKNKSISDKE